MSTVHLWSPLPPAEFAARLAAAIDSEPIFGNFGIGKGPGKMVVGSIDRGSMRLRRRSDGINSSSQPRLIATFQPSGVGTRLTGKIGVSPSLWVFMAALPIWMALGAYFVAP